MKKEYSEYKKFFKSRKLLLFIGILCICIPPLFFWSCHLIVWGVGDKHELGQLGDIIGGTTAPFIGLLGAILIYISFNEQVKANEHLKDETNRVTSFKIYDTIVDLMKFTMNQYESLIKDGQVAKLDDLLKISESKEIDESEKEVLKKYRCVLDLIAQCCDCIREFKNIPQEEFDYKNQLRSIFVPHYHLFYKDVFKKSVLLLNIKKEGKEGKEIHFNYMGNDIEIKKYKDVRSEDKIPKGKKVVYFIAMSIKNIVDCMENRDADDYYEFRGISKKNDE